MEKKTTITTSNSSIGFTGILTIVFIVLKLIKVISWSWIWVLSPIWISFALGLIIFIVTFIIGSILEKKER